MQIPFNVNYEVKVKLTDYGRAVHKEDHRAFWTENRRPDLVASYKPPVEDAEGWSTWQLWGLMEKFGQHMIIGFDHLPFEPDIQLIGPTPVQLKRYDGVCSYDGGGPPDMQESPDGEFVRFDDLPALLR